MFKTKGNRHRLFISLSMGIFSQWSGNGVVSTYHLMANQKPHKLNELNIGIILPLLRSRHRRNQIRDPANPHKRFPPTLEPPSLHIRRLGHRPSRPPPPPPHLIHRHANLLHHNNRALRQFRLHLQRIHRSRRHPNALPLLRFLRYRFHTIASKLSSRDMAISSEVEGCGRCSVECVCGVGV